MQTLRFLHIYVIALALTGVVLFVHLGSVGFISDSEIWSVTLAAHIREEWVHAWVMSRPLFYGVIGPLVSWLATDSITTLGIAKLICILNGLILLYLEFKMTSQLCEDRRVSGRLVPWFAVAALVFNSGFLSQGYRIRSDLFACTLVLLALNFTLRLYQARGRRASARELICVLMVWAVPMLATPKAILQIVPGVAWLAFGPYRKIWSAWNLSQRIMVTGCVVGLALGLGIVGIDVYRSSLVYFVNSFRWGGIGDGPSYYWTQVGFAYLLRVVSRNWLFVALFCLRLISLCCRFALNLFVDRRSRNIQTRFLVYCALDLLVIVLAPERSPFFIAALLAPLACFVSLILEDLWLLQHAVSEGLKRIVRWIQAPVVLLLGLALGLNGWSYYRICLHEDSDEKEFTLIEYFERYLGQYPQATYYDVIGILPLRARLLFFAGKDDDVANMAARRAILSQPPEIIFYTYKCSFLEPQLGHLLKQRYFPLGQGAFARWEELERPITVARSSEAQIGALVRQWQESMGTRGDSRFRAELRDRDGNVKTVQTTLAELVKEYNRFQLTRLSVFTDLSNPPPLRISEVFSFDDSF